MEKKIAELIEKKYHIRESGAMVGGKNLICDCCQKNYSSLIGIESGNDIKNDKYICSECLTLLHPNCL